MYARVGLIIASVSLLLAIVMATAGYFFQYEKVSNLNRQLIQQYAVSSQRTAAISAYLDDETLAMELLNGLAMNDLIAGARIKNTISLDVSVGDTESGQPEELKLLDPFTSDEDVGTLWIYPNNQFILDNVRKASIDNALFFLIISLSVSLSVAFVVHKQLTSPIRRLTDAFLEQSDESPDNLPTIDIGYKHKDEFDSLINGINQLNQTIREQFSREQLLRQHFEKLQHHFKLIFEQASAGIGIIDIRNQLVTKNPAFNIICPPLMESELFTSVFLNSDKLETHLERLRKVPSSQQIATDLKFEYRGETRVLHCLFASIRGERSVQRVEDDVLIEVIAYDVTERSDREKRIKFEADHDALTGLFNRRAAVRETKSLINASSHPFALMMIDLDKFKPVNDNYGHDAGDIVLRQVGKIIKRNLTEENSIACRWGGDEFFIAISLEDISESSVTELATALIEQISHPVIVEDDTEVSIGASIGIVTSSKHGRNFEELINIADQTMYKVKQTGRNKYLFAESE